MNKNLKLMEQLNKYKGKNTFKESLRNCLCELARNEKAMKIALEKNPQMYQFTMKVALEEQKRRENQKNEE